MYSIRQKTQWICLVLFALIPLLFSASIINNFKIANLIHKGQICDVLTFYYDKEHSIKTHNIDYAYVFLPAFANMEEIGVETTIDIVEFRSPDHTFSIKKGQRNICQFQPDVVYEVSFINQKGKILATDDIVFYTPVAYQPYLSTPKPAL